MNISRECSQKEIDLIKNAGINIEDKDYSKDDLQKFQNNMIDFIMTHSTKNGDISKLRTEYVKVFDKFNL